MEVDQVIVLIHVEDHTGVRHIVLTNYSRIRSVHVYSTVEKIYFFSENHNKTVVLVHVEIEHMDLFEVKDVI